MLRWLDLRARKLRHRLLLPAFVAYMTQYQIKPEERALLAQFGSEFAQYMSSVRRWL